MSSTHYFSLYKSYFQLIFNSTTLTNILLFVWFGITLLEALISVTFEFHLNLYRNYFILFHSPYVLNWKLIPGKRDKLCLLTRTDYAGKNHHTLWLHLKLTQLIKIYGDSCPDLYITFPSSLLGFVPNCEYFHITYVALTLRYYFASDLHGNVSPELSFIYNGFIWTWVPSTYDLSCRIKTYIFLAYFLLQLSM